MKPQQLLAALAFGSLVACGSHDAPQGPSDSAIAAATAATSAPVAKNAHVAAMDLGHAVDVNQRITGGVASSFHQEDSIFVSLRTAFVDEGAALGARLIRGKTTADSIGMKSTAPSAEGQAYVSGMFAPPAKGWAVGSYQLEVFLEGVSQGLIAFEVVK